MADKTKAKFLYFKTHTAYENAKAGLVNGAIAFDNEGKRIYVKADATHTAEYYIGNGIVNSLTSTDASAALSAAQGYELYKLIAGLAGLDASAGNDPTQAITLLNQWRGKVDASLEDHENRIDAIEILDVSLKAAIVAVAKACAANELENFNGDNTIDISAGSVDANTVDGSIMDGVTKAKIKVRVKSGGGLKTDASGIYVNLTDLDPWNKLTTNVSVIDTSVKKIAKIVGNLDGSSLSEQIDKEIKVVGVNTDSSLILKLDSSTRLLQSKLAISYDSKNQKIQLTGLDGSVISEFSASAFVKDGMLNDVKLITTTAEKSNAGDSEVKTDLPYIRMSFNQDADAGINVIRLSVKSLVDVYTIEKDSSTYLDVSGYQISAKVDQDNGLASYNKLQDVSQRLSDTSVKALLTNDSSYISATFNVNNTDKRQIDLSIGDTTALKSAVTNANSAVQTIKINNTALAKDASAINITVGSGDASGQVKIGEENVSVTGLKTAAYTDVTTLTSTMDEKDAFIKNDLTGDSNKATDSSLNIYGVRKYADTQIAAAFEWYIES